ncbi:SDR family NAD(P)-dependent oxidoreductase [Chryseobacterium paridis]|uniref:SDR family NAD(P)-dependent oxidoreductase n=1 Tax=Chryseobacterium paridis TaxID=2800328 RepID=A0ABS1FUQ8_9FLAO|nr:SDR family NAD(P)-dependent oxidoreductase [Chryseobacterium paridis]MBK1896185.1 SDR family NAD(P)-dependent oxidoreductase [Chryseobacterium paridis]
MEKVWFITGSSSGLGRILTEAVLSNGGIVAATARTSSKLQDLAAIYKERILVLELDVTKSDQIQAAVSDTISKFGRIDVLVNNAGFGVTGATEAFTAEQIRDQFTANLLAPVEICRAVLPYMRKQKSGRILNLSSVGGLVASIGLSIYQSAKFGLTGFSEALAKEMMPLGIRVTSVEPGGMGTNWAGQSMSFAPHVEGYEETVDARVDFFKSGKFVPKSDPNKVAKVLIELADHPEPPIHLVLGSDAVGILKNAELVRKEESEKWMPVTLSTDADNHK